MNMNLDDPRLTAYALDELDAADRAAVEAILTADPEARRWVEDVRKTAQQLEAELQNETTPSLTTEQARTIERMLGGSKTTQSHANWWSRQYFPSFRLVELAIVVGCIAILAGLLLPALSKAKSKASRVSAGYELRQMALDSAATAVKPLAPPADVSFSYQENEALQRTVTIGPSGQFNTESYAHVTDNPFLAVADNPLSTFSIDVDTASYAVMRRFLNENHQLPPQDAVRVEEMINYFNYDYQQPRGSDPFSVNVEVAGCPWNSEHRLVRVGLKGREIARDKRPPSNLVFLIDVSGSMNEPNKLPLLKESLKLLARQLTGNDRVSIVVYAGAAGQVLPSTSGSDKASILRALDKLQAGGSTHGSQGIQLAYAVATENFIEGGVNRVILCTDGDFNVGITSPGELTRLIEDKAGSGVFLSVLGFGMGNYKDSTTEMLADKGNGNYAYIDTLNEGRKVLVEQMSGTLVTIAKDVKIQIEFNPTRVNSYRLIGYENRLLAKEDFNNDKKDAGEIGAGHAVTALYEVVPAEMSVETPGADPLKYQKPAKPSAASDSDELLTLKLRYKQPDGDTSRLLTVPVKDSDKSYERASVDFKFAAAVAEFGMILRDSPSKGSASLSDVWKRAKGSLGDDREGYRAEFLTLVEKANQLSRR